MFKRVINKYVSGLLCAVYIVRQSNGSQKPPLVVLSSVTYKCLTNEREKYSYIEKQGYCVLIIIYNYQCLQSHTTYSFAIIYYLATSFDPEFES